MDVRARESYPLLVRAAHGSLFPFITILSRLVQLTLHVAHYQGAEFEAMVLKGMPFKLKGKAGSGGAFVSPRLLLTPPEAVAVHGGVVESWRAVYASSSLLFRLSGSDFGLNSVQLTCRDTHTALVLSFCALEFAS
jgi:hypothetical protein